MSMLAVVLMAIGTKFFYVYCCQCVVECDDEVLTIYVSD
jgi:hypothetical protein